MNKAKHLFKIIGKHLEEKEENDEHNLLGMAMSNLRVGNVTRLKEKEDKINAYFEYSPEVFDIVKNYQPTKLMKFLNKIK